MPLVPALVYIVRKRISDMLAAGDHLPSEDELYRRLRRRRREEEALILYGIGELTLEEAKELIGIN